MVAEVAAVVAFPENLVLLVVVAAVAVAVEVAAVEAAIAALVLQVPLAVALRLLITPVSNLFIGFQFNKYTMRFHPTFDTNSHLLSPNCPIVNRFFHS